MNPSEPDGARIVRVAEREEIDMDTPHPSPTAPRSPSRASARWWILPPLIGLLACGPAPSAEPDAGTDPDTELPDGGDGNPDDEDPILPTQPVKNREDQLRELGFDLDALQAAPRKLNEETALGEHFSPIGTVVRLAPHELAIAGMGGTCSDARETNATRALVVEIFHEGGTGTDASPEIECVAAEQGGFKPTFSSHRTNLDAPGTQSTRTLVSGDFDGDGLDEGITFNGAMAGGVWTLHAKQFFYIDPPLAPVLLPSRELGPDRVWDTASVSGDFNGDSRDDALVGMIQGNSLVLLPFLQDAGGRLSQDAPRDANVHSLDGMSGILSLTMAVGNLDTDHQHEVVVVVRAFGPKGPDGQPIAEVRTFVFDHLSENEDTFPLLKTETLTYTDPDFGADQNVKVADVAIGDFDGDGLGEIAYTGIGRFYDPQLSGDGCGLYTLFARIVDDLTHGGEVLTTRIDKDTAFNCSGAQNYGAGAVYERFARTMEFDGNLPRELLANHQLLRFEEGALVEVKRSTASNASPMTWNFLYPDDPYEPFSESNASLTAIDVTGDGRDEVIAYNTFDKVLSLDGAGITDKDPRYEQKLHFEAPGAFPQIIPFNPDVDGSIVRFIPGSHKVVLSEPLVQAVLAAPPYSEAWGQSPAHAVTSYSTSSSTGTTHESTLTTSVGASLSVNLGFGLFEILSFGVGFGAAFEESVTVGQGSAYTLTRTDSFETEGEDAVVFTAVPYDVYDYRILRSDEPGMVGKTMSIMLPRSPTTRVVSRTYFNARVPEGGMKIGEEVFSHVPGAPRSYMTLAQKNVLSEQVRLSGQPFVESGRKTIGEGNTATTTSVEVTEETFHSRGYGKSRTFSVEYTGGIVTTEFTMGRDEENHMVTTYSTSTTVEGSIPSITVDDTEHPDAVYDFGIFTYMQPPKNEGQSFQVINYWVE